MLFISQSGLPLSPFGPHRPAGLATNATNSTTIVQGIRGTYLNWEAGNHRLLCPEPSNKNKIQNTNR